MLGYEVVFSEACLISMTWKRTACVSATRLVSVNSVFKFTSHRSDRPKRPTTEER